MASSAPHDMSNGWEAVANKLIALREHSSVGVEVIRTWARNLSNGAEVLDLGCGAGVPVSTALVEAGHKVYGVDASPTLAAEFQRRFLQMSVVCESVETSSFFDRCFDGVVAIGLVFLLSAAAQRQLILKVTSTLKSGGHFLFTSPYQICKWQDNWTRLESLSLGKDAYLELFSEAGLILVSNYTDEGENYYFHAKKP
ncbi:class I SAM-dependent methyltransferase [Microbulbifer sp. TYP-18]|uniref:class I SAM-dependent methyltransferase n=1 Tax=Microbulbifer sp. TYP-18 TaxID=3230024 RepID=UPI0034C638B8